MSEPAARNDIAGLTDEQIDRLLQSMADRFGRALRSPILHSPPEYGLEYENVTFPSIDGTPLEGWYIPAPASRKILIANHPLWFNRAGLASHLEPWKSLGAAAGNDFEVNFVPDYKILHDAGYNVLAYDLRNFGLSGAANGGIVSSGIFEARDVLGSLQYVRTRQEMRHMTIGLFSRCMGCNSTFFAMTSAPEAFDGVRCLVAPQPITTRVTLEQALDRAGVPAGRIDDVDERIRLQTSIGLRERVPVEWAKNVRIPTYLYQVHDDLMTRPSDIQAMFDNLPVTEKKLDWIYGTSARWDGYLEFQRRPEPMLKWFEKYMS